MVGHEKLVGGRFLEPLGAVPGHVLNHQARAVGDEDHIQQAVGDDCPVQALNHMGQHRQTAGRAKIGAVARKDVTHGAFSPVGRRGVDGFLDIGSVKIDFCSIG